MAANEGFNADIDLGGHRITNVKIDPITTSARTTLASTLGANDKGRTVYDTDQSLLYVWTGSTFSIGSLVADWNTLINKPSTFPPTAHTHTESQITDLDKYTKSETNTLLAAKLDSSQKGQPAGVATLGLDGKVPSAQLPPSGDMKYKGDWNAQTNTPTLASGTGSNGDFYRVSVAGATILNGNTAWSVGDFLIFNSTLSVWQKFKSTGVQSVFGRQGIITAQAGDYSSTLINNASGVSGSTVSDALNALDSGKANTSHIHVISDITALQAALDSKLQNIGSVGAGISLVKDKVAGQTIQNIKSLIGINGVTINDTTDALEISGSSPSAGLANSDHASILNVGNSTYQSVATATNVVINTWDTNGPSQQGVVPSFSTGRLTIGANGVYAIAIAGSAKASSGVPIQITISVRKNGTILTNFKTTVTLQTVGVEEQFSKIIPLTLASTDYLDVVVSHDSLSTNNILISDSMLTAIKQDVSNGSATWGNIIGTLSNQTDLQTALDGKAALVHTHVEADITDLDKYTQAQVNTLLAGKANVSHTHTSTQITNSSTVSGASVTDALNTLAAGAAVWGNITGLLSNQTDLQTALNLKLNTSLKGTPNGLAELDSSGRLPTAQLPISVMEYKGSWNATTNSPALTSSVGDNGDTYLVSVAGTTSLNGVNDWGIGDAVVYNGTLNTWQKIGRNDLVTSVFGRLGIITAQNDDYNSDQITNNSTVAGAYVSDALNTLLNSFIPLAGTTSGHDVTGPVKFASGNSILGNGSAGFNGVGKFLPLGPSLNFPGLYNNMMQSIDSTNSQIFVEQGMNSNFIQSVAKYNDNLLFGLFNYQGQSWTLHDDDNSRDASYGFDSVGWKIRTGSSQARIASNNLTTDRIFEFPDEDGVFALQSDLVDLGADFVPINGTTSGIPVNGPVEFNSNAKIFAENVLSGSDNYFDISPKGRSTYPLPYLRAYHIGTGDSEEPENEVRSEYSPFGMFHVARKYQSDGSYTESKHGVFENVLLSSNVITEPTAGAQIGRIIQRFQQNDDGVPIWDLSSQGVDDGDSNNLRFGFLKGLEFYNGYYSNAIRVALNPSLITGDRTLYLPDKSGTLATVSDIGSNFKDLNVVGNYTVVDGDQGTLFCNGGSTSKNLTMGSSTNLQMSSFFVSGKIQLLFPGGMSVILPNGTTYSSGVAYNCKANSFYVIYRNAFTGTSWNVLEINNSKNILPLWQDSGFNGTDYYATNDVIVYSGKLYKNITGTNSTTAPDTDTTNWVSYNTTPTVVSVTRSQLQTLITNSTLDITSLYSLSNPQQGGSILIKPTSTNTIDYNATWLRSTALYAFGWTRINGTAGSVDTLTVNGVNIMTASVPFATSTAVTAANVVTNINANSGTSGYRAVSINDFIVVIATTASTTANGFVIAGTVTTLTFSNTQNMTNGATPVTQPLSVYYDIVGDRVRKAYDPIRDITISLSERYRALFASDPMNDFRWGEDVFSQINIRDTQWVNNFGVTGAQIRNIVSNSGEFSNNLAVSRIYNIDLKSRLGQTTSGLSSFKNNCIVGTSSFIESCDIEIGINGNIITGTSAFIRGIYQFNYTFNASLNIGVSNNIISGNSASIAGITQQYNIGGATLGVIGNTISGTSANITGIIQQGYGSNTVSNNIISTSAGTIRSINQYGKACQVNGNTVSGVGSQSGIVQVNQFGDSCTLNNNVLSNFLVVGQGIFNINMHGSSCGINNMTFAVAADISNISLSAAGAIITGYTFTSTMTSIKDIDWSNDNTISMRLSSPTLTGGTNLGLVGSPINLGIIPVAKAYPVSAILEASGLASSTSAAGLQLLTSDGTPSQITPILTLAEANDINHIGGMTSIKTAAANSFIAGSVTTENITAGSFQVFVKFAISKY